MAMKKLKLAVSGGKRPIEPVEIFSKLTLRGTIENIWEPQAEALRGWSGARTAPDVLIQMNTGGGKTLVGLLVAQSLTNEIGGRVLYVCPNNQLVQQTADRAAQVGLSPALRYRGDWTRREQFDSGETFCLTNYATVFNGKSIFRLGNVSAVVFDDAHVAEAVIRDQFTLKISRDHAAFAAILDLCRRHFANSPQATRFQDIADNRHGSVLFVPMFVVWHQADVLRQTLLDHNVESDEDLLFAWQHLGAHLRHCCIIADSRGMEITPPVLPLSQLPCFAAGVRRVYLTATLPSAVSFARTFGIDDPRVVQPKGRSGDAQRLFVFLPGDSDQEQRDAAKELVTARKCCVISPSRKKAQDWVPPAEIFDSDNGQPEIERFASSTDPEMLALVARYDGIDLPGDACKVLILDRVPTGESRFDRFIDEGLSVETIRTTQTATRVVQAVGRIFRSNTDHGVVMLVGPQLQSWLRSSANRGYLPKLLQQQILLGNELQKEVEQGHVAWPDLIDGVLTGDKGWDDTYKEYIDQFGTATSAPPADWYVKLVVSERAAFDMLWKGQPGAAAEAYAALSEAAAPSNARLAAWYDHWRGLSLLCADDRQHALHAFVCAANVRSELGRPSENRDPAFRLTPTGAPGVQAQRLAEWYRKNRGQMATALSQIKKGLVYGPDTGPAEESLRLLGDLLGLKTSRPDKKLDTGPDVTWTLDDSTPMWGFELKTNKAADGEYSKGDIAQCHDHEVWLRKKCKRGHSLAIVGRLLPVSLQANPLPDLLVIELEAMRDLLHRVKECWESVDAGDKSAMPDSFQNWLEFNGLAWPICVESLDSRLAEDLRSSE